MHDDLVKKAVKWLRLPLSKGGPGCHAALSECKTGFAGEIADAIGFRACQTYAGGSVTVEVKVSRSDFLADKNKPHRHQGGVGNWRYYLCPEYVIQPSDLPPKWGLLWVGSRGKITSIVGPTTTTNIDKHKQLLEENRFDSNADGEFYILVRALSKVGEPDQLNRLLRVERNKVNRLANENDRLRSDNKRLTISNLAAEWND